VAAIARTGVPTRSVEQVAEKALSAAAAWLRRASCVDRLQQALATQSVGQLLEPLSLLHHERRAKGAGCAKRLLAGGPQLGGLTLAGFADHSLHVPRRIGWEAPDRGRQLGSQRFPQRLRSLRLIVPGLRLILGLRLIVLGAYVLAPRSGLVLATRRHPVRWRGAVTWRPMSTAYVLDAVRSPFGRYGGGLAGVRPDDLAAHVVGALLARAPSLDPARVDDVLFGDANQAGEDNRNVARMAWLLNDLPTSVPGSTINRLCGSSLDAAMQASRMIECGDASLVLVGGVESMSRAPWVLLKTERPFPREHLQLHSSTLGWRMVNPRMPERWTISLGRSAEKLAQIYSISRESQDEFALRSHRRALAAWDNGFYAEWVVPIPGVELQRDENIRPGSSRRSSRVAR
jgi:hypothetical protein